MPDIISFIDTLIKELKASCCKQAVYDFERIRKILERLKIKLESNDKLNLRLRSDDGEAIAYVERTWWESFTNSETNAVNPGNSLDIYLPVESNVVRILRNSVQPFETFIHELSHPYYMPEIEGDLNWQTNSTRTFEILFTGMGEFYNFFASSELSDCLSTPDFSKLESKVKELYKKFKENLHKYRKL